MNNTKTPSRPKRKHNPVAKDLRSPRYRPDVVRMRKGKGSYTRKGETYLMKRNHDYSQE